MQLLAADLAAPQGSLRWEHAGRAPRLVAAPAPLWCGPRCPLKRRPQGLTRLPPPAACSNKLGWIREAALVLNPGDPALARTLRPALEQAGCRRCLCRRCRALLCRMVLPWKQS